MLGFINIFYDKKEIPKIIITNTSINKLDNVNTLGKNFEKTKILQPLKGPKKNFLKFAEKNARINLELKLNKLKTFDNFIFEIKKLFKIKNEIKKIEAYDNSHTFGSSPVGVMVAYNNNGLQNQIIENLILKFENNKKNVDDYYTEKC